MTTNPNHKKMRLTDNLTLYLYSSGQATLDYRGHEVETFMWDDEVAEMFDNFDDVKAAELFNLMYRKRWKGLYEK